MLSDLSAKSAAVVTSLGLVAGLLASSAASAQAVLEVDALTGAGRLLSDTGDVEIVAYQIESTASNLEPSTWISLQDQGFTGWAEFSDAEDLLNEGTFGDPLVLSVDGINIGIIYDVSAGLTVEQIENDLTFAFGEDGEIFSTPGIVRVVIPEPTTAALIAAGALVMLRRKRA